MEKPYRKMPPIYLGDYMLRTIKKSDAKDMFEYGKNIEVTRYLNWGPFHTLSEAKKSIKNIFYPRLKEELPIGYAIIDVKSLKMIGTIDFHSKMKGENGAEIGFVLHIDYWNKGIMTNALDAMIKIGFEYLGYEHLKIKHLKSNIASQKVIEKSGFKFVKVEPYSIEKYHRILRDELLTYELLKEDYHGNQ
ncbi:MAG: GNAT family N-acetyltransferase [Firmicutes bacterium]|nr:GNAT family N-acetyltransferase [Bacillota bacterium]